MTSIHPGRRHPYTLADDMHTPWQMTSAHPGRQHPYIWQTTSIHPGRRHLHTLADDMSSVHCTACHPCTLADDICIPWWTTCCPHVVRTALLKAYWLPFLVFITSFYRTFGCPIICIDTYSQLLWSLTPPTMPDTVKFIG